MSKRSLRLRSETLAELAIDDLRIAVGGASGLTCPVRDCVEDVTEFACPSRYNCPTWEGC